MRPALLVPQVLRAKKGTLVLPVQSDLPGLLVLLALLEVQVCRVHLA
ncbi:hypothetical protein [uncultured Novosphingobium sp.]|nr:hypothetical protein [uncultured Novosphingobium sp.]